MSRRIVATCPCCGYVVFDEPPGSYAICPICFWEDDHVQLRFPTLAGGANKVSLIESQLNFARFGACEERFVEKVRKPKAKEIKDQSWRLIDTTKDWFEKPFGQRQEFIPYPDDFMTLYYWKDNFWLRKK